MTVRRSVLLIALLFVAWVVAAVLLGVWPSLALLAVVIGDQLA